MTLTRRGTLLLTGTALSALAGCTAPGGDDGTGEAGPTDTASPTGTATEGDRSATDGTATDGTGTPRDELDLREANVTGVEASRSGGSVGFDVTLYHDDDGEDGYANWWQVERIDGTRVGRRDLTHAHGTREFTRSDDYEVPDDVTCVVVRGHDQTHGYGGQAALVNLETGAVRLAGQGSEPRSFSEADCP